jgi:lysozyme
MSYDLEPAYALIRRREGFAPVAKWDYRQYSGGYGTKAEPGQTYTPEQAETAMRMEVAPLNNWLDQNVKVPMSDNQRAALLSFGYNTGIGSLQKIADDINAGDWSRVAGRIQGWNKAGGSVLGDLADRRAEEGSLLTGQPVAAPLALQGGGQPDAPTVAAQPSPAAGASPLSLAGAISSMGGNPQNIAGTGISATGSGLSIPGLGVSLTGNASNQAAAPATKQDDMPMSPLSLSPIRRPLDMRGISALAQSPRLGILNGV